MALRQQAGACKYSATSGSSIAADCEVSVAACQEAVSPLSGGCLSPALQKKFSLNLSGL